MKIIELKRLASFNKRHKTHGGVTGPNRTEERYNDDVLHGEGQYEAVTLKLKGGSRYTADYMTWDGRKMTLHEVKGAFRFGSESRASAIFREAVAQFPMICFVWAKLERDKTWSVEVCNGGDEDHEL